MDSSSNFAEKEQWLRKRDRARRVDIFLLVMQVVVLICGVQKVVANYVVAQSRVTDRACCPYRNSIALTSSSGSLTFQLLLGVAASLQQT